MNFSELLQFPEKRRASPNLEDEAENSKKICLQAAQPDLYDGTFANSWTAGIEEPNDWKDLVIGDLSMIPDERASNHRESPEVELSDSTVSETEIDTCFGVITVDVTTSFFRKQTATTASVRVQPCGDILKLNAVDSGDYVGIVTEPALARLLVEHNVEFNAALTASWPSQEKAQNTKGSLSKSSPDPFLRIVVYGSMKERSAIGTLLSDAGLYLQHPSQTDIETALEYFNPHYLIRPGAEMPRIEDLAIECEGSNATMALNEKTKTELMNIFDAAGNLEIDPTKSPSPRLQTSLQTHQLKALSAMSEKECASLDHCQWPSLWKPTDATNRCNGEAKYRHIITGQAADNPPLAAGGILADEMGLGKTLSVLSLICWSLDILESSEAQMNSPMSRATLIVAPKSTLIGWQTEIEKHIVHGQIRVATYHGTSREHLAQNLRNHDIILTTYETLRRDYLAKGPLYSEDWFRVVLDEAHRIRNRASQTFLAACELRSLRRWCLTGTPIQNSLDDYGALLSFVQVAPFIKKQTFDHWIAKSIPKNKSDGFSRLRSLIKATCLRRLKRNTIQFYEIPIVERDEIIDMDPADRELHDLFRAEAAKVAAGVFDRETSTLPTGRKMKNNILVFLEYLRLICNHGESLLPPSATRYWHTDGGTPDSWRPLQREEERCTVCFLSLEAFADPNSISEVPICAKCLNENNDFIHTEAKYCGLDERAEAREIVTEIKPSAKVRALIRNLDIEQATNKQRPVQKPIKSVVFSCWTKMLDHVCDALQQSGYSCERLHGKMSLQRRRDSMYRFDNDPKCTVMLATIGSSGEGINLTSASHVHLLEPQWNPMAETQAIARVHRYGQLRNVTATKYITSKSIEEYVRFVQQKKLDLIETSWGSTMDNEFYVGQERWKRIRKFLGICDDEILFESSN